MNKKILIGLVIPAMVIGLFTIGQDQAEAEKDKKFLWGELTSPADDKPFGGEEIVGDYYVRVRNGDQVRIFANLDNPPAGMVLEGWLVDTDTGYSLSTGKANDNNVLIFSESLNL